MNVLYANIVNEIKKIYTRKLVLSTVITLLVPIAAALILANVRTGLGIVPVSQADFPVKMLDIFTGFILPLFIAITAADAFAGEMGDKTIKLSLLRPISRLKVFSSKILALGIFIAVNLGLLFIISIVSGFFVDMDGVTTSGLLWVLSGYASAFFPMLLIGIAAALVSQFFKTGSSALAMSILIFLALKLIAVVFPGLAPMIVTTYTGWHSLILSGAGSGGQTFLMFMYILSYSIIFLSSGYYLFEKKEF